MTLEELLDVPPEEFRSLALAALEATRPERGLHRLRGMADFLVAVHWLQRIGWKRAPRGEVARVTGYRWKDSTQWAYATWLRRRGLIDRKGGGFRHKPTLPPTSCRSYSLVPEKFSHLYENALRG